MRKNQRAFTLLEVIMAVVIIGMIAVTVYRFVSTMITAITISMEHERETETMTALYRYIGGQLDDLPPRGQSLLLGYPHNIGGRQSDELQWRCQGGAGTLTDAAEGDWFVTLQLRAQAEGVRAYDLGLRRRPVNGGDKEWNWVPLLRGVEELKFEYFDPRLNAWLDRWNDQNARPLLVRIQMWRTKDTPPEIAVFTINGAQAQQ